MLGNMPKAKIVTRLIGVHKRVRRAITKCKSVILRHVNVLTISFKNAECAQGKNINLFKPPLYSAKNVLQCFSKNSHVCQYPYADSTNN